MSNENFFQPGQLLLTYNGNLCFVLNEILITEDRYKLYFIHDRVSMDFSYGYVSKYFKPVISKES